MDRENTRKRHEKAREREILVGYEISRETPKPGTPLEERIVEFIQKKRKTGHCYITSARYVLNGWIFIGLCLCVLLLITFFSGFGRAVVLFGIVTSVLFFYSLRKHSGLRAAFWLLSFLPGICVLAYYGSVWSTERLLTATLGPGGKGPAMEAWRQMATQLLLPKVIPIDRLVPVWLGYLTGAGALMGLWIGVRLVRYGASLQQAGSARR